MRDEATVAGRRAVPSALLIPTWATPATVESTVIRDGVITVGALCTATSPTVARNGTTSPTFKADCATLGTKWRTVAGAAGRRGDEAINSSYVEGRLGRKMMATAHRPRLDRWRRGRRLVRTRRPK